MSEKITIDALRTLFTQDDEFAVIDPRDRQSFSSGHMLAATNIPLDRLEARIECAVPNRDVQCLFCDAGGGEAGRAADRAEGMGYTNVAVIAGGVEAWQNQGGQVFTGSSVPGKAFGEFIGSTCDTPSMTAAELYARQQAGDQVLLIDSRTREEHESYCIPGAVLCPGAELMYRALPLVKDGIDVVIHCGGRTRSIIGAQTLIEAGCDHVYALENGTMAWQFEGYELETGNTDILPKPDPAALVAIQDKARQMAEDWYIDRVSSIKMYDHRCRYLIDVRSRAEYEDGHIKGSIHVPGGHLLQNVDRYLAVRNASVILIDGDRVRAAKSQW